MKLKVYNIELSNGYIQTHLSECPYCHNKNLIEQPIDQIEHIITELNYFCPKCKKIVGYWSYGHVEFNEDDEIEVDNEGKAKEI